MERNNTETSRSKYMFGLEKSESIHSLHVHTLDMFMYLSHSLYMFVCVNVWTFINKAHLDAFGCNYKLFFIYLVCASHQHFIRLLQPFSFLCFSFLVSFDVTFFSTSALAVCTLRTIHQYFPSLNLIELVCSLLFTWPVVVMVYVCIFYCELILELMSALLCICVWWVCSWMWLWFTLYKDTNLCRRKSHSMTLLAISTIIIHIAAQREVLLFDFGTLVLKYVARSFHSLF